MQITEFTIIAHRSVVALADVGYYTGLKHLRAAGISTVSTFPNGGLAEHGAVVELPGGVVLGEKSDSTILDALRRLADSLTRHVVGILASRVCGAAPESVEIRSLGSGGRIVIVTFDGFEVEDADADRFKELLKQAVHTGAYLIETKIT